MPSTIREIRTCPVQQPDPAGIARSPNTRRNEFPVEVQNNQNLPPV
jgi:hypothetical protein